ncbi:9774_t:CDS:2, partial [Racocetra persica]
NKEKELLRAAQPVVTIILAINNLEKKIAEKEKNEKTEMDQEKFQEGINAI